MAENWRKFFPDHPIFRHERPDLENVGSHILAISDSEIFLACDGIVRYTNALKSKDYVELATPDVDFTIKALYLNRSRTLLCIVGLYKVVVVRLPRAAVVMTQTLQTHVIGELNHKNTQIQQVSIHPYSASDNAIVILTQDSYLRLYDLNLSCSEAETTVDLLPSSLRKSVTLHYLGDISDTEAASFCFGIGGEGWSTFTTFVLMRNGDVYAVCPLMPADCSITSTEYDSFNVHAASEAGTHAAATLIRVSQAIENGTRTLNGVSFARPPRMQPPVVLGPLLLSPAPLEFSTQDLRATSIIFLASKPLNLLAIAYDGKVDICQITDSLQPSSKRAVEMSVHESILLPSTYNLRLSNSDSDTSLYVIHNSGVHEIEMKFWLTDLQDAFVSEDDQKIRGAAAEGISSLVTVLLDSAGSALVGLSWIEHDLDKFLVLVRDSLDVHVIPTGQPLDTQSTEHDDDLVQHKASDAMRPHYEGLLQFPSYRPRQSNRSPHIVIPANIQHRTLQADVDSVNFLQHFATQMRKDIRNLMNLFVEMHRRFALQEKEFKRQTDKVEFLAGSIASLEAKEPDRLKQALERQTSIEKKCSRLVQDLMQNQAPQLSDAEKRYFEELKRIEKHALGTKGLLSRIANAKSQLSKVQDALPKLGDHEATSTIRQSPLRSTEIGKLKTQIECNDAVLEATRKKVERICKISAVQGQQVSVRVSGR